MPARSSRRELEIVSAIAEALNSAPTVQEALERTLELVTDLLGLQTGWVWLLNRETGHIYSAAARNLPPYLQEPLRMSGGWCLCIEQFRDGSLTPRNVDVMECSRLRPAVRARQTDLTHGLAHHASAHGLARVPGVRPFGHGHEPGTAAQSRWTKGAGQQAYFGGEPAPPAGAGA